MPITGQREDLFTQMTSFVGDGKAGVLDQQFKLALGDFALKIG
jgi:hypothetical protein